MTPQSHCKQDNLWSDPGPTKSKDENCIFKCFDITYSGKNIDNETLSQ